MQEKNEFYHRPVLLNECIEALNIKPDGVYLDGTLGGGGHSAEIFKRLGPAGRLIGIDRDGAAIQAAAARIAAISGDGNAQFQALRGNFHDAPALLRGVDIEMLDGALLDLGVSSHQLDERARGFSYHADAPLDMRMDQSQTLTARTVVNEWPEDEIKRVLRDYGEENWAAQIARVICDRRKCAPIETTGQLVGLIDASIPKKFRAKDDSHPARRAFQGIRIAVNDELAPLERALYDLVSLLKPGGRLAVISFHSLEDRLVKNAFRTMVNPCTCPPGFPVCVCGRKPTIRLAARKPIAASEAELSENPRARSALLRIAEKLGEL